jgi:hypothetical protein
MRMSEEHQPRICLQCDLPLIELYGERLCGCVGCNNWQALNSGECSFFQPQSLSSHLS